MHRLYLSLATSVLACCLLLTSRPTHTAETWPARSEADLARDIASQPQAVLDFFGVAAGMTVVDMFAGNGYYSELAAHRVTERGKIYLHNNQAFMQYSPELATRVADNRLPNVEVYVRELQDINLASNSVDVVLLVLTYHDAYFVSNGWDVTSEPLLATILRILKPGGTLGVIDHKALPGSGAAAAQRLHRIDPEFARAQITRQGFHFAGSTDLLHNPQDSLADSVFEPAIRGQTSRFVYKFTKPLE